MRFSGEESYGCSGGDSPVGSEGAFRILMDRCTSLEASHARLKEQLSELMTAKLAEVAVAEEEVTRDSGAVRSEAELGCIPGFFREGPYKGVVEAIGHALHVCSISSGEIIYWNPSAETLYGWKDYEVLGKSVADLLIAREHYAPLRKIIEGLHHGRSWSGQFPLKKRSGEMFMALVTKSPFYEDGEFTGIVTVASDAAIFSSANPEQVRTFQYRRRLPRMNLKSVQWHAKSPIAPVPQIASSVSNLATKFMLRKQDDVPASHENSMERAYGTPNAEEFKSEMPDMLDNKLNSSFPSGNNTSDGRSSPKFESPCESSQPSKFAAKVLAKLNIRGMGKFGKEDDSTAQIHKMSDNAVKNEPRNRDDDRSGPSTLFRGYSPIDAKDKKQSPYKINLTGAYRNGQANANVSGREGSLKECKDYFGLTKLGDGTPRIGSHEEVNELEESSLEALRIDEVQRQSGGKKITTSGESTGNHQNSSSKEDNESNSVVGCEIQWEKLRFGEEIGQGSCGVVYRGIWNGSEVAIKVYFGNDYKEETLQGYKKEIDMMKRLRHPNVILFMGAVHSAERLAIVTEFLPRGSLFKTLHKNSQSLDVRRCLRMALDIARGMNYLHHRNPPIVHRDLKSSNLLVDKNWTVKVGDFGLSKWKHATFLTARSGRGTPQWMAPEVLRNEPSNEKCDLFSFGVILWELMTVSVPWSNLNSLQVVGVVGFMDRRLELPESLDPKIASIIRDCWRSEPDQRPSFEELIERMMTIVQKVATGPVQRTREAQN